MNKISHLKIEEVEDRRNSTENQLPNKNIYLFLQIEGNIFWKKKKKKEN